MKPEDEEAVVVKAIQSRPTDYDARDVKPLKLRRKRPPSPIPPPQRTVFQPGSDWASSSTKIVLDALHASYESKANDWAQSNDELELSRCSGSVAVDGKMADLFDTQAAKPTQQELLEPTVVQCKTCLRPVLVSRLLEHKSHCSADSQEKEDARQNCEAEDEQLDLMQAPFCKGGSADDASSTDTAVPRDSSPTLVVSSLKRSSTEKEFSSPPDLTRSTNSKQNFRPVDDDWETRLLPEPPRYIPRGAFSKRRRVPLPILVETNAQKKRSLNIEKKALQASIATGIVPLASQKKSSTSVTDSRENPISELARELGDSAPWSKLMQIAMPVTIPRNLKARKVVSGREQTGLTGASSGFGNSTALSRGQNEKSKSAEGRDKHVTNLNTATPSLVGSLSWIRSQGIKELSNTTLYAMDAPQVPMDKTRAMYHGQTYVAELGHFETDPRAPTTIKMPLAASTPPLLPGKPAPMSAPAPKVQSQAEARSKKQQATGIHGPGTPNGVLQQPINKKRNSKTQKGQSASVGSQMSNGVVQGKPVQNSRRMGNSARMPGPIVVGPKSGANSYDSQHRAASIRNANPLGANNVASSALSNVSGAVANYAAQQLAQQKKGFRQVNGPEGIALPNRSGQSIPLGTGPVSGMHLAAKPSNRPTKGRQIPSHVPVNASHLGRAAGGKIAKTPSPSQASSRSTERIPLRRGNPVLASQNDSNLMANSMLAATTALNRATAARGDPGKAQLELQQAFAQAAAAGRESSAMSAGSRGILQHGAVDGQIPTADKFNASMQRANMAGVVQPGGVKYPGSVYGVPTGPKGASRGQVHMQVQKDGQIQQKAADLEAQLRRTEAIPPAMLAGKSAGAGHSMEFGNRSAGNIAHKNVGNHLPQNVYSSALAAASQRANGTALKGQANMGLFPMQRAAQSNVAPAGATPDMLQNLHDMRALQNMRLMPGMQAGGRNANMLGFLPPGLSAGIPHTRAMNNGVAAGIPAGAIPSAPNPGMHHNDAILQILAGRGGVLAPNATGLAAKGINPVAQHLAHSQAHQMARAPGGAMARPVIQAAAIDEIDRALGLTFDESDLKD